MFFRLLHMVPTLLILSFIFLKYKYFNLPPWLDDLRMYRKSFAHDHFLNSIYPYAALSLLACLDSTVIVLLPWLYTEFSFSSTGFPNMFALRFTNFYKIFQDTLRFICNVIYIIFTSKTQAASVSAFLAINMLISIISIALSFMVAVMKASTLYQIEKRMEALSSPPRSMIMAMRREEKSPPTPSTRRRARIYLFASGSYCICLMQRILHTRCRPSFQERWHSYCW